MRILHNNQSGEITAEIKGHTPTSWRRMQNRGRIGNREVLDEVASLVRDLSSGSRKSTLIEKKSGTLGNWPALAELSRSMDRSEPKVGDMPPQPPTVRAKVGAVLVRVVRRALFWYTEQILQFQQRVARAAADQMEGLHGLSAAQTQTDARIEAIHQQIRTTASSVEALKTEYLHASESLKQTLLDRQEKMAARQQALNEENDRWSLKIQQVDSELHRVETALRESNAALTLKLEQASSDINRMRSEVAEGETKWASKAEMELELKRLGRQAHDSKVASLQQSFRTSLLLRELRSGKGGSSVVAQQAGTGPHLDELVRAHADAFRGSSAEIKERLRVYLPDVREAVATVGSRTALDLGCGRGEWLELMRDEGVESVGIDGSRGMVEICRNAGLDARREEVAYYLRSVSDGSLAVLTAFHLIEHLSLEELLEVIDHAVRVLRPGGMVIFETPNPKNFLVSSHNFFMDPTHVRPLPNELLAFLMEERGLCEPKAIPLHPYPDAFHLGGAGGEAEDFINKMFFGPQDYGMVARKA